MAVILFGTVIFLLVSNGGKEYPGLTIYAAALYSFYKIIMSTFQVIKVRNKNSPLLEIVEELVISMPVCLIVLSMGIQDIYKARTYRWKEEI